MVAATAKRVYSDEKVRRLFRNFSAVLSFCSLIAFFEIMILRPAGDMEKDFSHMDPTEILGVPFPLEKVVIFVMFPVLVLIIFWTIMNASTVIWNLLSLTKITGLTFVLFGLCGKNLIQNWQHSIAAALYISALLCTNLTGRRTSNILEELPFYDHSDLLSTCRLYITIVLVIACSILSVLDHGKQIQRWPVPVLIGGTYGFCFGTLIGITIAYFQGSKKKEKK